MYSSRVRDLPLASAGLKTPGAREPSASGRTTETGLASAAHPGLQVHLWGVTVIQWFI